MADIDGAGSYIKINRHISGWTWNISVATASNTLDDLQDAKEKALQLNEELRKELLPPDDVDATKY